jgi:hypothetical protein
VTDDVGRGKQLARITEKAAVQMPRIPVEFDSWPWLPDSQIHPMPEGDIPARQLVWA